MAGAFNPLIRIKGYTADRVPVNRSGRQHEQWRFPSRATLATDYLLGLLALVLAKRRAACAPNRR